MYSMCTYLKDANVKKESPSLQIGGIKGRAENQLRTEILISATKTKNWEMTPSKGFLFLILKLSLEEHLGFTGGTAT